MGDSDLYDTDILIWSERQAAALRSLASRRDLPNELDLANVIEEIEDVGRSEFHSVESLIENILSHIVLLWADPDAPARRGWIAEIAAWDLAIQRRITPSMRGRLDFDSLWEAALRLATTKLAVWDEDKAALAQATLSAMECPFMAKDFPMTNDAIASAVSRIQAGAGKLTPH